jgi:hypothetical protein
MITRNLHRQQVCNGMQGSVVAMRRLPDRVTVQLVGGREVALSREAFTKYHRDTGACIATRSQIPLRLSYAVTGKLLIIMTYRYNMIDHKDSQFMCVFICI